MVVITSGSGAVPAKAPKFYTQAALKRRDWLPSMIEHFLGAPDAVAPAPFGQAGHTQKFDSARVHAVEALPEFVAARELRTANGGRYCSEASLLATGWTSAQVEHYLGAPDLVFEDVYGVPPRKMYALWRVAKSVRAEGLIPDEALVKTLDVLLADTPKFACRSTLLQRGWTESLIEAFLGAPDQIRKNPNRLATNMNLYALSRVTAAEASPDFIAAQSTARPGRPRKLSQAA